MKNSLSVRQAIAIALLVSISLLATPIYSLGRAFPFEPSPAWSSTRSLPTLLGTTAGARKAGAVNNDNSGRLPLTFELNQGQSDARVKFLCRGPALQAFFATDEQVLVSSRPGSRVRSTAQEMSRHLNDLVLRMKMVGGNQNPRIYGLGELPSRKNYFIGGNPANWHTNIPTYRQVKYEAVYPGIDLTFYGVGQLLEYDFTLAAGANPSLIGLTFKGAQKVRTNTRGELVLHTRTGDLRMRKPIVYQEDAGTRRFIEARYEIKSKGVVRFKVGTHDPSRPLVIDPVVYSTYLGGSGTELAHSVTVDSEGNAYITGETTSTDFPEANPLPGDPFTSSAREAFITKFDGGGDLVYSTYLGGGRFDAAYDIAVDSSGNAVVTGVTNSFDDPTTSMVDESFPTTLGAYQTTLPHQDAGSAYSAAFITRLGSDGDSLDYSTLLGGTGDVPSNYAGEQGKVIAVDNSGNMYVSGIAASPDFPTTSGAYQTSRRSAFLSKINSSGLVYSTYYGGSGFQHPKGIAVDTDGYATLTGTTNSSDFPTTSGARAFNSNGFVDPFVTRFNASGTALIYSTNVGGSSNDYAYDVAVDGGGTAFVTGNTQSGNLPVTSGALKTSYSFNSMDASDAWVAALDSSGAITYCTYLGGSNTESCQDSSGSDERCGGIALDNAGAIYVAGNTQSSDFPYSCATVSNCPANTGNIFIMTFTPAFGLYTSSRYYDGNLHGTPVGIGANGDGTGCVIAGFTSSTDFPTTSGALQTSYQGNRDAFVMKVDDTAHGAFFCTCQLTYYEDNGDCECAPPEGGGGGGGN